MNCVVGDFQPSTHAEKTDIAPWCWGGRRVSANNLVLSAACDTTVILGLMIDNIEVHREKCSGKTFCSDFHVMGRDVRGHVTSLRQVKMARDKSLSRSWLVCFTAFNGSSCKSAITLCRHFRNIAFILRKKKKLSRKRSYCCRPFSFASSGADFFFGFPP